MTIPKGSLILAGCSSKSEKILWLLDIVIKDAVMNIDSCIGNTPDFLRIFEEINATENLPLNAKTYSIDKKATLKTFS